MAFLTPDELSTHLYGEIVEEITRGNEGITLASIDAGTAEAKSYLTDYDAVAIFAAIGDARNAMVLFCVKDIAAWHLICLANPNVEMALREKRYDAALKWLRDVQSGKAVPDLPPRPVDTTDPEGATGRMKWGSNPKNEKHF